VCRFLELVASREGIKACTYVGVSLLAPECRFRRCLSCYIIIGGKRSDKLFLYKLLRIQTANSVLCESNWSLAGIKIGVAGVFLCSSLLVTLRGLRSSKNYCKRMKINSFDINYQDNSNLCKSNFTC
jgi:hypothetical protein